MTGRVAAGAQKGKLNQAGRGSISRTRQPPSKEKEEEEVGSSGVYVGGFGSLWSAWWGGWCSMLGGRMVGEAMDAPFFGVLGYRRGDAGFGEKQ